MSDKRAGASWSVVAVDTYQTIMTDFVFGIIILTLEEQLKSIFHVPDLHREKR